MTPRSKARRAFVRMFWRVTFRWYGFTARLGDKRHGDPVIPAASITALVARLLGGHFYMRDKLDAMKHPRIVQARLNRNEPIGDCDDHAAYIASVLLKSALAKKVYAAQVHMERDGQTRGHVFVLFTDDDRDWFAMDYFVPVLGASPRAAIERIVQQHHAEPIIAAWMRVELRDDDGLRLRREGGREIWR